MTFHRFVKLPIRLLAFILALPAAALAQCAMCKASVANAENAAEVSGTINAAVLVLLIPTLLILGGLVRFFFKYRHSPKSYVHFRPSDTQRNFE